MTIKVQVKKITSGANPAKVQVKTLKQTGNLFVDNPNTLSSKVYLTGSTNRLIDLSDVKADPNPVKGEVPVYEPSVNKYVIEKLDFDELVGDINDVDGGTF